MINNVLTNLDLFFVGMSVAAIGILGLVVFLNRSTSVTSRSFIFFAGMTIVYGVVNYLNYQSRDPLLTLWLLRLTIFSAVWHAFSFTLLFYVFPLEKIIFSKIFRYFYLPLAIIVSFLNLTPLVFPGIAKFSSTSVSEAELGPAMPVFGFTVIFFVVSGFYLLISRLIKSKKEERFPFMVVSFGAFMTFISLIIFNFIFPVVFENLQFIPLAPVFFLPFIFFTTYAIIRHHLFNIKVIATEILTFILAVTTLVEVILSDDPAVLAFRISMFILVLIFGIFLIRSVRREVEQREELEALTEQLGEANSRLTEMDKMKSQFYSFVSHQIKTPIGIIKGFASLLTDGSYGILPDKAKETVVKIGEAADRLIKLVENFLDLRKIEAGKMEYNFENINLVEFAKKEIDALKLLAARKNLSLVFESDLKEILVRADTQRLGNVFQNLVDNAIKYTEKGWVRVRINNNNNNDNDKNQKFARITVSDSGRGMSKELLPTLFEQFNRDAKAAKTIAGTGLGLYLAKEIITGHGGKIWAESEGEGKGSSFVIELPMAVAPPPVSAPVV